MALRLSTLLEYSDIVVQCHDNPDADALACGFALKWYLRRKGKKCRFIYSGEKVIEKSNLVLMINKLGIDVDYVRQIDKPELLVTVDCQYGEGNVTRFEANKVAVIDHHQVSKALPELNEVRSNYASCSTILYKMLMAEGIDINEDTNLATALYYGLMTDSNSFVEISHPSDRDLRDFAKYRKSDIFQFRNSNFSKEELKIAGDALKGAVFDEDYAFGIVKVEPCDPNLLGIISDMLLEVDSIGTCLVYSILPFGIKISVRSCIKEVKANELAAFLADGFGGGGGHLQKGGGFLKRELLTEAGIIYDKKALDDYIYNRMREYFISSQIIYAGRHFEDPKNLKHYVKKPVSVGYVRACDLAEVSHTVMIRTLEGDVDVVVEEDLFIIIGIDGEIYPCRQNKFEASYSPAKGTYFFEGEYAPSVVDLETGEKIRLFPHARKCIAKGGAGIYARQLENRVKVFTSWDTEKYYLGQPGDYLAVRVDDLSDIYVIAKSIFDKTYELTMEP